MRFQIDKQDSSTCCSTPQSRFRRWRRRSATRPFKWSFRCSTTAKECCLWIWKVICVANELSILRCSPVSIERVVVEVDVGFRNAILRPPSRQPLKRDGNASQARLFTYSYSLLEWLEVKCMKVTRKFMSPYLFAFGLSLNEDPLQNPQRLKENPIIPTEPKGPRSATFVGLNTVR
jgi:hypothetical protein